MQPLVFIDCETTGLDPERHEILEIAAIRVHPQTLDEERELVLRVRPERLEDADPEALEVNGYRRRAWADAVSLGDAMAELAPMLEGAVLAGHNVAFDRRFLEAAWDCVGHRPENLDHHALDTAALAFPLLMAGEIDSLSLTPVCAHLGVLRGEEHWAFDDVRASLGVAQRLLPAMLAGLV
ncbi:3'-5' exonuclease [Haliangium ochraceum]|uniref:Exonuclease RNase T and DNA polymerase III n=1 Tax=Haliangium ochraceum (strain DSM 14365 / JCM 11303 / SMP-2) TaxID=502025 RepID=D0LN23_HALO1|nr:3'-5' exonuclease [Haliangium ochraceum]ACY13394.1 Exonuclease RNase T and DNA polymerase III [Haliangium ochraceum DSM 14365]